MACQLTYRLIKLYSKIFFPITNASPTHINNTLVDFHEPKLYSCVSHPIVTY